MEEYQQRVWDERKELEEKLCKLIDFINGEVFPNLLGIEQTLLKHQAEIMGKYARILSERIFIFR